MSEASTQLWFIPRSLSHGCLSSLPRMPASTGLQMEYVTEWRSSLKMEQREGREESRGWKGASWGSKERERSLNCLERVSWGVIPEWWFCASKGTSILTVCSRMSRHQHPDIKGAEDGFLVGSTEVGGHSYTILAFVVSKSCMLLEGWPDSPALFPLLTTQRRNSHPLDLNHTAEEGTSKHPSLLPARVKGRMSAVARSRLTKTSFPLHPHSAGRFYWLISFGINNESSVSLVRNKHVQLRYPVALGGTCVCVSRR